MKPGPPRAQRLLWIAATALGYWAVARIGVTFGTLPGDLAPVWPSAGVGLAAVFVFGPGAAPGVFIGEYLARRNGLPVMSVLGMASGNTAEALIGSYLLKRYEVTPNLSRPRDVGLLMVLASVVATVAAAVVGNLSLAAGGVIATRDLLEQIRAWWIADALGVLIVAPLILTWRCRDAAKPRGTAVELVALAVAAAFTSSVALEGSHPSAFMLYPVVGWAALRFGGRGASLMTLLVAGLAVRRTASGFGPFASDDVVTDVWLLETFLTVLAAQGLLLAAVVRDRDRSQGELEDANAELETRVAERTTALQIDRQRLEQAQRIGHIGSWEWDALADAMTCSAEMQRLYDIDDHSDALPISTYVERIHPDDVALVRQQVRETRATGGVFDVHHRIVSATGELRWLRLQGQSELRRGVVTRMNGVAQDVTERQVHKAQLDAALADAREASRSKSAFLANMSHEIRTPMNGVLGMIGLLLDTPLDARQLDYAQTMAASAEALLGIIDDILDVSKIEAGKLSLDNGDFAIRRLVQDTIAPLMPAADEKGIALTTVIAADVPDVIHGDRLRLRQVMSNLLSNAVKFTARGSVQFHVTCDGASLLFEVTDTGVGIADDAAAYLFEPFVQADVSTTRRYGGTGLGLAISRQLVTLMRGQIQAEPRREGGSRFYFTIPLVAAVGRVAPSESRVSTASPAQTPRGRVLVVEDNAVNRKVAVGMLEQLGYSVEIAEDGCKAVEKFAPGAWGAILMDCQMPRMDGYDATRAIRTLEPSGNTPIIAMTASAMTSDRERCLAVGMDEYLPKPINRDLLATVLRQSMESRDQAMTTSPTNGSPSEDDAFDAETLDQLRSLDTDGTFIAELVDMFRADIADHVATLRTAIAAHDQNTIARTAHQAKGASANLGMRALAASLKTLELDAGASDHELSEAMLLVEAKVAEALDFVDTLVAA